MSAPVVINGRAAVRSELGGVERWARELVERLPALQPDRYRVAAPPRALAHRAGQVWEQAALPAFARGSLLLSPANLAPVAHRGNVVVIHDLAPLREPHWYGRAYGAWHRAIVPRVARSARLVVVPSRFVADEVTTMLGVVDDRVRVVAPGVSGVRRTPADAAERAAQPDAGRTAEPGAAAPRGRSAAAEPTGSSGSRPFVLAVGTASARKNLGLLDALAPRLRAAGLDVVVAGGSRDYLRADAGGGATRLGYVSEDQLAALYADAAVLAMPSLYEGFGLPCIEAMAAGTPVVAAARAALPETCSDAALLVDPDDRDAFADALATAAFDETARERLIAAGRTRADAFTWARTATAVDAAIASVLRQ